MTGTSMETDPSTNRTQLLTEIHPCYQTDGSHALTRSPSALCALFHVFLSSLAIVTVCGNLLVIISIVYFTQLHTPTNSLILSLAVADLLVGAAVFPLTMEFSVVSCLYSDDVFCKVRSTLDVSLCTASILNLCCISIDRYHAVCQPLTYRAKITQRVVVTMISASWAVSLLIGVGFIIVGANQGKCGAACLSNAILARVLGLIFSFYLPVMAMLCVYMKICLVAQRQARSIQSTSTKSGASGGKTERKATKTLAVVMGVFLMSWLPFFLCTTVLSLTHVNVPLPVIELLNWLALSNSTLNPFIYAFFYSWFRSAFRTIVSGKLCRGDFANSKLC